MELDNDIEVVDMRDYKFPTSTVLIQSPELTEPKQNRPIFNSSNGFDLIDKGELNYEKSFIKWFFYSASYALFLLSVFAHP